MGHDDVRIETSEPFPAEVALEFILNRVISKYSYLAINLGSPYWKHSELLFEKKGLIPALQQLIISQPKRIQ